MQDSATTRSICCLWFVTHVIPSSARRTRSLAWIFRLYLQTTRRSQELSCKATWMRYPICGSYTAWSRPSSTQGACRTFFGAVLGHIRCS